jgi:hypothetical protein
MVREGRTTAPGPPVVTRRPSFQRSEARLRKAARDVFLVAAALLLLGAQAFSTLHYVLVPHHLCAEHGVLEDGGASVTSAAHEATPSAEAQRPSEQDEHEVCSVATRQEHAVLLERAVLALTTLSEGHLLNADTGVALVCDRAALLSSAPKTSPPLRA